MNRRRRKSREKRVREQQAITEITSNKDQGQRSVETEKETNVSR